MPIPQSNIGIHFRQHLATLIEMQKEVSAQARRRPNAVVPEGTMKIVRRHLADMRRLRVRGGGRSRVFPAVPGGVVRFSTLALLLAMIRHEYETFGRVFEYDREPEPPQPQLTAYDADEIVLRVLDLLCSGTNKLDLAGAPPATRLPPWQ